MTPDGPQGFIEFYENGQITEKLHFRQLREMGVSVIQRPYGVDLVNSHAAYKVTSWTVNRRKLPIKTARLFHAAFDQLVLGNIATLDIKKLEGREGFRLRIGNYRAIYRYLNEVLVIEVVKIGSRGDIYK